MKKLWNINHESIGFQRVLLKQDGRTKFGGKNPMQQTVIEWENKIANADHSDEDVILPLVLTLGSDPMKYLAHDSYRINITSIDAEHDISMREVYGLDKTLRE